MTHHANELQMHLDALQEIIGQGNASRGFHDEGDHYREQYAKAAEIDLPDAPAALRNYYMTKIALIVTEAAEALEELRNGHEADKTYYKEVKTGGGRGLKPEGVPSEIADIVIRAFDFADEAGFSLGEIIIEKLAFNATRGEMHGGKTV